MFPEELQCNASDVAYIAKDCLIGNFQKSAACMEWGDIDDDLRVLNFPEHTVHDLEDSCSFAKKCDDHVPEKTFNDYGGLLYGDQCLADSCSIVDFDTDDLDFHDSRIGKNFASDSGKSSGAFSTYTSLDELIDLENDLTSASRNNTSVSHCDASSDPFFEEEDLGFQVPNLFENELADSIMMIDDDFLNDVTQSSDIMNVDGTINVEDDSFLWGDNDHGKRKNSVQPNIDDHYLREAFFIKTGIRIKDVRVVLKRLSPMLVVKSRVIIDNPHAPAIKTTSMDENELERLILKICPMCRTVWQGNQRRNRKCQKCVTVKIEFECTICKKSFDRESSINKHIPPCLVKHTQQSLKHTHQRQKRSKLSIRNKYLKI